MSEAATPGGGDPSRKPIAITRAISENPRSITLAAISPEYRQAAQDAAAEMDIGPNNGMGWAMIRAIIARDEIERMLVQIDGLVTAMPETIRQSSVGATEAVRVALEENSEGFAKPLLGSAKELADAIRGSKGYIAADIQKIYEGTRNAQLAFFSSDLSETTKKFMADIHAAHVRRSNWISVGIALAMIFGGLFLFLFGFWTAIAVPSNPLTKMIVHLTDPVFGWMITR